MVIISVNFYVIVGDVLLVKWHLIFLFDVFVVKPFESHQFLVDVHNYHLVLILVLALIHVTIQLLILAGKVINVLLVSF